MSCAVSFGNFSCFFHPRALLQRSNVCRVPQLPTLSGQIGRYRTRLPRLPVERNRLRDRYPNLTFPSRNQRRQRRPKQAATPVRLYRPLRRNSIPRAPPTFDVLILQSQFEADAVTIGAALHLHSNGHRVALVRVHGPETTASVDLRFQDVPGLPTFASCRDALEISLALESLPLTQDLSARYPSSLSSITGQAPTAVLAVQPFDPDRCSPSSFVPTAFSLSTAERRSLSALLATGSAVSMCRGFPTASVDPTSTQSAVDFNTHVLGRASASPLPVSLLGVSDISDSGVRSAVISADMRTRSKALPFPVVTLPAAFHVVATKVGDRVRIVWPWKKRTRTRWLSMSTHVLLQTKTFNTPRTHVDAAGSTAFTSSDGAVSQLNPADGAVLLSSNCPVSALSVVSNTIRATVASLPQREKGSPSGSSIARNDTKKSVDCPQSDVVRHLKRWLGVQEGGAVVLASTYSDGASPQTVQAAGAMGATIRASCNLHFDMSLPSPLQQGATLQRPERVELGLGIAVARLARLCLPSLYTPVVSNQRGRKRLGDRSCSETTNLPVLNPFSPPISSLSQISELLCADSAGEPLRVLDSSDSLSSTARDDDLKDLAVMSSGATFAVDASHVSKLLVTGRRAAALLDALCVHDVQTTWVTPTMILSPPKLHLPSAGLPYVPVVYCGCTVFCFSSARNQFLVCAPGISRSMLVAIALGMRSSLQYSARDVSIEDVTLDWSVVDVYGNDLSAIVKESFRGDTHGEHDDLACTPGFLQDFAVNGTMGLHVAGCSIQRLLFSAIHSDYDTVSPLVMMSLLVRGSSADAKSHLFSVLHNAEVPIVSFGAFEMYCADSMSLPVADLAGMPITALPSPYAELLRSSSKLSDETSLFLGSVETRTYLRKIIVERKRGLIHDGCCTPANDSLFPSHHATTGPVIRDVGSLCHASDQICTYFLECAPMPNDLGDLLLPAAEKHSPIFIWLPDTSSSSSIEADNEFREWEEGHWRSGLSPANHHVPRVLTPIVSAVGSQLFHVRNSTSLQQSSENTRRIPEIEGRNVLMPAMLSALLSRGKAIENTNTAVVAWKDLSLPPLQGRFVYCGTVLKSCLSFYVAAIASSRLMNLAEIERSRAGASAVYCVCGDFLRKYYIKRSFLQ